MGLKYKRALLIKTVSVVGIALVSGVFTFTQLRLLKLVSRVVSDDFSYESLQPQTASGDPISLAIHNFSDQTEWQNEDHLHRSLRLDAESVVMKLGFVTRQPNRTRASFKTHPHFSEQLVDEFIIGAKQEAQRRKKLKLLRRIIQTKKKKDRKRNKKPKKSSILVPTPIFVPSLPKSGTTTAHEYFLCGGQKSAHFVGSNGNATFKIGRCVQHNVRQGRAPFDGCGEYDVWTDTGYVAARYHPKVRLPRSNNIQCFYPLIDALEEVYMAHPNATFLFVVRETDAWLKSIRKYHSGFIMEVWKRCRSRGFPARDATIDDFREFYEWHKEMIRNFALDHPSWTFIEVDLESPDAGLLLEERVGISAECWGHYNKGGASEDEIENTTDDTKDDVGEEREER